MSKKTSETKNTTFTTIKAISETRPLTYKDLKDANAPYEPFLVNRAFSLSEDSALAASLMNLRGHLDADIQASFYIHALRPRRRFEKWPKSLEQDDVATIAKYYGMGRREATLHARLHTAEQITAMKEVLKLGAEPSRI